VLVVSRDHPTWNPFNLTQHLFRSVNGGITWTDIGVNLPPLAWAAVSGIAIDPNDANGVFVCFNGYWSTSPTSIAGANRVYHSGNGGGSWSDFTFNLLAFPVSCIIYQRGSNQGLFEIGRAHV
jgi:hypothetical protein